MDSRTPRPPPPPTASPPAPPRLAPLPALPRADAWDLWAAPPSPPALTASLPATPGRMRAASADGALRRKRSLPVLPRRPRTAVARGPRREVPNVSLAEYAAAELPDLTLFVRALFPLFGRPASARASRAPRPPRPTSMSSTSSSGSASSGGNGASTRFYFSPSYPSSISQSSSSIASGFESPLPSRPSSPSGNSPIRRLALPSMSTESLTDVEEGPAGGLSLGCVTPENSMDGLPQIDCTMAPPPSSSLLLRSICDLYLKVMRDCRRQQQAGMPGEAKR